MQNIDITKPTDQQFQQALTAVEAVQKDLSDGVGRLDPKERQRMRKPRAGAFGLLGEIISLAKRYGAEMPGMTGATMEATLEYRDRVRELHQHVGALHALLGDMLLLSEAQLWRAETVTYSTLRRLSKGEPQLKRDLAKAEGFFARKRSAAVPAETPALPAKKDAPTGQGAPGNG